MSDRCVGCGKDLQPGAPSCACGAAAAGGFVPTAVIMDAGAAFRAPQVCCCCLRPAEKTFQHRQMVRQRGNTKEYATFPMPWCASCLSMHRMTDWAFKILMAVAALAGIGLVVALSKGGAATWVSWVAGIAVAAGLYFGVATFLESRPAFNLRGHVQCCNSFRGATLSTSQQGGVEVGRYRLVFGNAEFARRLAAAGGPNFRLESKS